jgi:hypothetical protein
LLSDWPYDCTDRDDETGLSQDVSTLVQANDRHLGWMTASENGPKKKGLWFRDLGRSALTWCELKKTLERERAIGHNAGVCERFVTG